MSPKIIQILRAVPIVCAVLGAVPADAQIYSWRDGTGTPVFSDRRPADGQSTQIDTHESVIRRPRAALFAGGPYAELIARHAAEQGVRAELVHAVIRAESGFNARARSPKGALGLMQLMPATAAQLGVVDPLDPGENIRGGVTYLRQLLSRYGNDVTLALAAYNAGPGAVERYGLRVPPYAETRRYVSTIQSRLGQPTRVATPIIKTVEEIGGRQVPRYSNVPPAR